MCAALDINPGKLKQLVEFAASREVGLLRLRQVGLDGNGNPMHEVSLTQRGAQVAA